MCVQRKVEECPYNSYIEYQDRIYVVIWDEGNVYPNILIQSEEDGEIIEIGGHELVISHYLSPLERRKIGEKSCCRGLRKP